MSSIELKPCPFCGENAAHLDKAAALRWTRRNTTTMYDVTITNCETLVITRKQVQNPLEALSGIEWVEMSGQNQVEAQYDFRITTKKGEIIHIKAREMT